MLIVDVRYTKLLKTIGSPDTTTPLGSVVIRTEPTPPDKSDAHVRLDVKALLVFKVLILASDKSKFVKVKLEAFRVLVVKKSET